MSFETGNPTSGSTTPFLGRLASLLLAFALAVSLVPAPAAAAGPSPAANLDQCKNGDLANIEDPCDWVNGNLNANQAHYAEGDSVAYRTIVSNLDPGSTVHSITIGWDVRNGGKNAIDYLTSYDRIDEAVNPCEGVSPCSYGGALAIPAPAGAPQPAASFAALPPAEKFITIFGGTLIDATYLTQGSLTAATSETTMRIRFAASDATVVIAWGGHIADRDDWGIGVSAGGISGSPYHMRLKDLDGKGGNQDRSLGEALLDHPVQALGASLTVVKEVVNENSGTAVPSDFPIHVLDADASDVAGSPQPGDAFGTSYVGLPAGSYQVTEEGRPGYILTYSGDCGADGSITLADGDIKTCILTNTDPPSFLTVTKLFVNDDGGSAGLEQVQLFIDGVPIESGVATEVLPGLHNVTESGPAGYAASFAGDCDANGTVLVGLGESRSCLLTDDDIAPRLTVTKLVVNDDGGPASAAGFDLFVGDTQVLSGDARAFDAGTYQVSESGMAGYAASFGGDCDANGTVSLFLADDKECILTNDDIAPRLTVTKVVVNDNGGLLEVEDFPLSVDGLAVASGDELAYMAGLHTVAEAGASGYAASFSGDCDDQGQVQLAPGDVKQCTITNDDIQPRLTVLKVVVNDNGGEALVEDALLFVDGQAVVSGQQFGIDAGAHLVNESGPFGYAATFSGDCEADGSIALLPGDVKTCVLTNDDIQPILTVTKRVVNDNGGAAAVTDYILMVNGTVVASGEATGFDAAAYLVSESGPVGYAAAFSLDCDADGAIVLRVGDVRSCLLTNDDIQPRLTVSKIVINDDGGRAEVGDFALFVGEASVASGVEMGFDAGSYAVSESGPTGYAASFSGDCDADGIVSLAIGETKHCVLTNDDIQPRLTVTKIVINDDGGAAAVADFPLFVGDASVSSGEEAGFDAASYLVSEAGMAGYAASFSGDCDNNGTIVLALADVKECILTNDDIQPILTVTKIVINDDGGAAAVADFPLFVGDAPVLSGEPAGLDAGHYNVSEAGMAGYAASFSGDCDANGTIRLALADVKSCTITNDDIAPRLRVVKVLVLDDGGIAATADFSLHVDATDASPADFAAAADPGVVVTFDAGAYAVSEAWRPDFGTTYSADCSGTLGIGEEAVCVVTNDDLSLASRTQGFWQTHTKFTQGVFASKLSGSFSVGAAGHLRTIDSDGKLFGAYYSSIAKTTTGADRSPLDQARMQLVQQLVTAKLNCAAFGCSIGAWLDIQQADAAFAGSDAAAILASAAQMDAFNNANDAFPMPDSVGKIGGATPKTSQTLANRAFWNSP